jgi:hypothetical protein
VPLLTIQPDTTGTPPEPRSLLTPEVRTFV